MSSYHLQLKPVSHGAGRTATAAAAYRSGELIACEATGQVHDYRRKGGVDHTQLVLPTNAPAWAALATREQIWNLAEANDRRVNSRTALEFEIALPAELDPNDRKTLALTLASEIANRHQVIADVAIHRPNNGGDQRNHHAHILITTRQLIPEGLGAKVREFSSFKDGPDTLRYWRARWADLQNDLLAARNVEARVDHRSLHDQGIDREPGRHDGPTITAIERGGRELELQGRLDPDPVDDDLAVTIERIKTARDKDLASTVDTLRPRLTPSAATRRDQLKIDYEQRKADELRARSKLRLARIELDRYRKFHTVRATLEALFGARWDKHEQLAQDVDSARTAHAKMVDELDRINPAAAKLRQAQAALNEYRRSHTLVALAHDKFKIESKKILALEAAVLEARIEHLKAQKALEQAKKELDTATIRADLQEPRQLWLEALDLEREFRNLQRDISRVEKEQLEANQEQQAARQPAARPPAPRPPRPRGSGRTVIVSDRSTTPAGASIQSQIPAAKAAATPPPAKAHEIQKEIPAPPATAPVVPRQRPELVAEEEAWQKLVDAGRDLTLWHSQHPDIDMTPNQKLALQPLVLQVDHAYGAYLLAQHALTETGQPVPHRDDFRDPQQPMLGIAKEQAARVANAPLDTSAIVSGHSIPPPHSLGHTLGNTANEQNPRAQVARPRQRPELVAEEAARHSARSLETAHDDQVRGRGRELDDTNTPADPDNEPAQDDNQAPNDPIAATPATDNPPRPHRSRGDGRKVLKRPAAAVDPELAAIERLYRTQKKFDDVLDAISDRVHRQSAKDFRQGHNSLDPAVDWLKRRAPRAHQEVLAAIKGQELAAQDQALERAKPPDPDRGLGR